MRLVAANILQVHEHERLSFDLYQDVKHAVEPTETVRKMIWKIILYLFIRTADERL